MTAPTMGNTMNTHSWRSAQLPWNTAVAMLRAGFTEVLSTGIVMRWMSVSMSPTVMPVNPAGIDLRLVLAITKMKSAVNTISTRIAEPMPNPPGEWAPYPLDANPVALALNPGMSLAMM